MNILPLILAFILVFACVSTTFLKEAHAIKIAERSVDAAFRIENQLHSKLSLRHYLHAAHVSSRPSQGKNKRQAPHYSLRALIPPLEESKLNISALLEETVQDIHQHPLYSIVAALIRSLYQDSALDLKQGNKGWEHEILDAILTQGKRAKTRESLTDLFPDDTSLHALYYKMVKGTNQYSLDPGKKQGIAPLGDYLRVAPDKKEHTIHFHFASEPLLHALLGSPLASALLQEEKKQYQETGKHASLSPEELKKWMANNPSLNQLFSALEPYLSFQKKIPRKHQIAGKDISTGLVIKREIL